MTYRARTYMAADGKWWSIEITDGLPPNHLGVTQARRLDKAEQAARDVIADLLDVDPGSFELDLLVDAPPAIKAAQRTLEAAEAAEADARGVAVAARRSLATAAHSAGLTYREAAVLLDMSHQRVAQLVNDA